MAATRLQLTGTVEIPPRYKQTGGVGEFIQNNGTVTLASNGSFTGSLGIDLGVPSGIYSLNNGFLSTETTTASGLFAQLNATHQCSINLAITGQLSLFDTSFSHDSGAVSCGSLVTDMGPVVLDQNGGNLTILGTAELLDSTIWKLRSGIVFHGGDLSLVATNSPTDGSYFQQSGGIYTAHGFTLYRDTGMTLSGGNIRFSEDGAVYGALMVQPGVELSARDLVLGGANLTGASLLQRLRQSGKQQRGAARGYRRCAIGWSRSAPQYHRLFCVKKSSSIHITGAHVLAAAADADVFHSAAYLSQLSSGSASVGGLVRYRKQKALQFNRMISRIAPRVSAAIVNRRHCRPECAI
ncbi:MAG: hypothetical protein PHO37_15280 [Kiritimatiellae bacterium]|nr:hypothetical protein [Kiritimatiellia bacterium]